MVPAEECRQVGKVVIDASSDGCLVVGYQHSVERLVQLRTDEAYMTEELVVRGLQFPLMYVICQRNDGTGLKFGLAEQQDGQIKVT